MAQLQQKEETMSNEQVVLFLQQGLEYVMGQFFVPHDHKEYVKEEFTFTFSHF